MDDNLREWVESLGVASTFSPVVRAYITPKLPVTLVLGIYISAIHLQLWFIYNIYYPFVPCTIYVRMVHG